MEREGERRLAGNHNARGEILRLLLCLLGKEGNREDAIGDKYLKMRPKTVGLSA